MEDFVEIEKAHYTFPERLMELLENETVKEAMWWLPGGCAFAIRPKIFYDVVLSKYFQGTKFESFTRKLNRWGFRRLASQGVAQSTVAYYNKSFKQGQPQMVKNMRSGSKGKVSEAEKPSRKASPARPTSSCEVAQAPGLRDYLKNQSSITARQAQQGLMQAQPKEQAFMPGRGTAFSSMPLDLVAMQRRARLQAVQQMAAYQSPSAINDIRQALFSRVGMGILDNNSPVFPPTLTSSAAAPQTEALNPQLVQLLLMRERLGQSGLNR